MIRMRFDSEYRDPPAPNTAMGTGVRVAIDKPPEFGTALNVAAGVWWMRLPLTSHLGHVNAYLLEDGDDLTLVDAGTNHEQCRAGLAAVLESTPFAGRQVTRVIATHFHPDHIGGAGAFVERGAELWTSRLSWLAARMFQFDARTPPYSENIALAERAGMKGLALAAYRRLPVSVFRDTVDPLPPAYVCIEDNAVLNIGGRTWRAIIGEGHAPEHVTLWSDHGVAITGDQILHGMSTNLSIHPSDPNADLVAGWVASCERFAALDDDASLCLPGHHVPFYGASTRCRQLLTSQEAALQRLLETLVRPQTAVDCMPSVYGRRPEPYETAALIAETLGFLNHLHRSGLVVRETTPDRCYLWHRSRVAIISGRDSLENLHSFYSPPVSS